MSEHRKPAPGSGYERLSNPPIPPPQGTLSVGCYRMINAYKSILVVATLEDRGAGKLVHHLSISKSLVGERMKAGNFPADVQHALEAAFGMQGAEEDNSGSAGYAHFFWMLANPQGVN